MKQFPPRSLQLLEAQRDVLLQYARRSPVSCCVCAHLVMHSDMLLRPSECLQARLAAALGSVYVLMQTFAIPGTLWLSLLCGALYGVLPGITLVSGTSLCILQHICMLHFRTGLTQIGGVGAVLNMCGSMSCYMMSWMVGRTLVRALYPEQLAKYAKEIAKRRAALFNYVVILRATPVGHTHPCCCSRAMPSSPSSNIIRCQKVSGHAAGYVTAHVCLWCTCAAPCRPVFKTYCVCQVLPNVFINVASPIVDVPMAPFALGK